MTERTSISPFWRKRGWRRRDEQLPVDSGFLLFPQRVNNPLPFTGISHNPLIHHSQHYWLNSIHDKLEIVVIWLISISKSLYYRKPIYWHPWNKLKSLTWDLLFIWMKWVVSNWELDVFVLESGFTMKSSHSLPCHIETIVPLTPDNTCVHSHLEKDFLLFYLHIHEYYKKPAIPLQSVISVVSLHSLLPSKSIHLSLQPIIFPCFIPCSCSCHTNNTYE